MGQHRDSLSASQAVIRELECVRRFAGTSAAGEEVDRTRLNTAAYLVDGNDPASNHSDWSDSVRARCSCCQFTCRPLNGRVRPSAVAMIAFVMKSTLRAHTLRS